MALSIEPLHVGCAGKKRFGSMQHAERAARNQRRAHEGDVFQAYHCEACRGWHVGEKLKGYNKRPLKEIS